MAHPLDTGKARFRKLVSASDAVNDVLPLVHVTDAYTLSDIIVEKQIVPTVCPVFAPEMLAYFFYGRPAYRANCKEDPLSLNHYFPVCLILKPDAVIKIRRVFPFDSGGFVGDFYASYMHRRMRLADFSLEPDVSSAGRVVKLFYSDNKSYMAGDARKDLVIDEAEFEAKSFHSLVCAESSNSIDSRGGAIEFQTDEGVDFFTWVAAVILPLRLMDSTIGLELKAKGVDLLPYNVYGRTRPNECVNEIFSICHAYYVKLGKI